LFYIIASVNCERNENISQERERKRDGNGISVIYIKEKKSYDAMLSSERLCAELCLITIIILVGRKGKKSVQDIKMLQWMWTGEIEGSNEGGRYLSEQKWNEKSCILINISFFMITLIWIFMLLIKSKFIQINGQENEIYLQQMQGDETIFKKES
jgi:hypothetical protein